MICHGRLGGTTVSWASWRLSTSRVSGDSPTCAAGVERRIIRGVRAPRAWLGSLSLLLLVCLGGGLVSDILPDETSAPGYYDGDDDDAVLASERMAMLVDLAFGARAADLPERTPEAFESPVEPVTPPIIQQSPLPPVRSPPDI